MNVVLVLFLICSKRTSFLVIFISRHFPQVLMILKLFFLVVFSFLLLALSKQAGPVKQVILHRQLAHFISKMQHCIPSIRPETSVIDCWGRWVGSGRSGVGVRIVLACRTRRFVFVQNRHYIYSEQRQLRKAGITSYRSINGEKNIDLYI